MPPMTIGILNHAATDGVPRREKLKLLKLLKLLNLIKVMNFLGAG
jgi:hypothetical protein